jgi:hypothetical protein
MPVPSKLWPVAVPLVQRHVVDRTNLEPAPALLCGCHTGHLTWYAPSKHGAQNEPGPGRPPRPARRGACFQISGKSIHAPQTGLGAAERG